jgi:predicted permease
MLLTAAGGVGGLMLGWWMLELIPALGLDEMPRAHEIRLDAGVVGIVAAATMAIGVFVGLMAVARLWRMDVNRALRDESRSGTASRRTNAVRRSLVTAQVALAFLLLIGAGLLLSSFRAVLLIDPGFRAAGAITGAMNLPVSSYPARAIAPFVDRLLDAVTRVPGVERAGVTTNIPLSDNHSDSVLLAEGRPMTPGESVASPFRVTISADYLQTMGIELVRGRYFDARDTATSTPALIVDERLAERLWPDEDPIGRRAYQPGTPEAAVRPGPETRWLTVVGVVRHVAMEGLASARQSPGTYYFAFAQAPQRAFSIVARSRTDEARTADDIRRVIAEIDPALAFHAVRPMSHYYDRALTPRRVPMVIATAFGGLALLLAALGVYGVLAYTVLERRREIGIRIALGSTAFEVVRLVIRDGVILVTAGLGLGVVAVVAFQRVLGAVLYGVEPLDASVLAAVVALLSLAALVAMIVPARRAATVNPVVVLTD